MRRFWLAVLILEVSLFCSPVLAQLETKPQPFDTTRHYRTRPNMAVLGFDKNLSTYQWSGIVSLSALAGPFNVDVHEQYRSTIIRTPRKLIRDEQVFNMTVKHPFGQRISALARASNFVLSDDQKFTDGFGQSVTTASSNAVYGGLEAEIVPGLFVEPVVGARFQNQMGVRDRGLSYALHAWTPGLEFSGYQSRFAGRFQQDLLHPRTLERRSLAVNVVKVFFGGTRDTLGIEYSSNQRDFYFAADESTRTAFNVSHNIERRIEDVIAFSNLLEYNVSHRLLLSLFGNLASRDITRRYRYRALTASPTQTLLNTDVDELRIGGVAQVRYVVSDDILATMQFHFDERDERHSVERDERIPTETDRRQRDQARKDNVSRRSMLVALLDARVSPSDTIRFSGSSSLLRYDTPHPDNIDDRDELWYALNLTTVHRINPYTRLEIAADVNLTHLVYLSALRSGNNAWNGVFRLAPKVHYVPSADFSTTNTFEVLANYTVYDFESTPFVQVTSFSFRQFALIDSTRWSFTPRLAWEGFVHLRLYQRGELRWDDFKERPLNYFEDKTFVGRIEYAPEQQLVLSVGVRYFSQTRFAYVEGKRRFESILKSIGPIGRVQWEIGGQSQLSIDGWRERQTQTGALPRSFTNMTLSIHVRL